MQSDHEYQSCDEGTEDGMPTSPLRCKSSTSATAYLQLVVPDAPSTIPEGASIDGASVDYDQHGNPSPASTSGRSATPGAEPGCLGVLDSLLHSDRHAHARAHAHARHGASASGRAGARDPAPALSSVQRLIAGCSLRARDSDMAASALELRRVFDGADGRHYRLRSTDYMKSREKIPSGESVYRLLAADVFSTASKRDHVASRMTLPAVGPSACEGLPPLLVINIQLPTYKPVMFGAPKSPDGPGVSIVYYFGLPDDFNAAAFPNQKALALLKRFFSSGGREADGAPTRDRLKMIPRVVNVAEWAEQGPLSFVEQSLLKNGNEKPVMTQPQHRFYAGPNYFEADLDIHEYTYVARNAFLGFMQRLSSVVFEVAFVVQGNGVDELPEQVLGAGRIYRTDFYDAMPLPP
ncbi:hypothetical protein FOA52_000459 [Chlamydomonas sp. UWO 241]|nr:hypothetical protein FOA52_000459 [Chlamydomonas sp. UWO 241]